MLFFPLCVISFLVFFSCLFALCAILCFFVVSFSCLLALCFLCLLHVHAWSKSATSKMQAKMGKMQVKVASPKRAMISRLGGLTLSVWFSLFLSLFFRIMFDLIFLYHVRPYPTNVGNVWFIFLVPCLGRVPWVWKCLIFTLSCTLLRPYP